MIMKSDLDLQQLRMFWMLGKTRSYTLAAKRLFRTQSAVSHAIRKLERSARSKLVVRKGRNIELTEEGKALFSACEVAFGAIESAVETIGNKQGIPLGIIRLGATVEFGNTILLKHMQPFLARHPEITLHFYMSKNLISHLLNDDLDIIIDCKVHSYKHLQRIPLFRERYVVVCSPEYYDQHRIDSATDLDKCTILSVDANTQWWNHFVFSIPEIQRPAFKHIIPINHIRGIITAAVSHMGIGLVPRYSVLNELTSGDLVELFPEIKLLEDRFVIYQKTSKATLMRHQIITEYLQSIAPEELRL